MAMKLLALALLTALSDGQSFDAASIKPSPAAPPEGGRWRISHTPNSLTMRNVDLTTCIIWAYQIEPYQISQNDPLKGEAFDILATAADRVSISQLRKMLQQLLAERFKLTLRRESKTLNVYELTVAKGGPKLPEPIPDAEPHHVRELLPHVDQGSFFFPDTDMAEFAAKLSLLRGTDRPVVDKTGIQGFYNITLKGAAEALRQENGPSLLTLLPELIGLKLVAAKAPVQFLIVDHAENPTAN
jgi:uncharacterized protein (TIGR03435 family)